MLNILVVDKKKKIDINLFLNNSLNFLKVKKKKNIFFYNYIIIYFL